jgi:hypothetical protein
MRQATESDLDFLADCYVNIACHMQAGELDLYIARLPEAPDEIIGNHVRRYVGREDALTLLEEVGGSPIACLLASIGSSSFSASRLGKLGHMPSVGWSRQTAAAASPPSWSVPRKIGFVKRKSVSSSFRMVKNQLAAISWQQLG